MSYNPCNTIPLEPSDAWLDYIYENFTYNPDTGKVFRKGSNKPIGSDCGKGYLKTCLGPIKRLGLDKRNFKVHHLCIYLEYRVWVSNEIDHKNDIRDDNRLVNLKISDRDENLAKRFDKNYKRAENIDEPF